MTTDRHTEPPALAQKFERVWRNPDRHTERAPFEIELRSLTRNVYVVNEKRPPSYERKWRVHVLWHDGTTSTYWGDDSQAGFERAHRDALREAARRG